MLRGRCGPTSPLPRTAFTVAAHHSDAPLLSQRESFTLLNQSRQRWRRARESRT